MKSSALLRYETSPIPIDYSLRDLLRLNLNENLVLPQKILDQACAASVRKLALRNYPSELDSGEIKILRKELARYCEIQSWKNILIGTGGDQLIDLLCQAKIRGVQNSKLITVKPTFSIYSMLAKKAGGKVVEVPLGRSSDKTNPFKIDGLQIIRASKSPTARILALASPNNPTGIQYDIDELNEILESIPSDVLVLLDEAYIEYADYYSKQLLKSFENLVILRTFSKAFGLASQRIGYLIISDTELAENLENFQLPFPINSFGVLVALELLKRKESIKKYAGLTTKLRDILLEELTKFEPRFLRPIPKSKTNFVLVSSRKSKRIFTSLLSRYKIAVKYLPDLERDLDFLRITVGRQDQNARLVDALSRIELDLR